ncbi:MAG: hypothetical protein C0617_11120 [Desulfuromonas sp.]|uniref:thermonuclease family protein n=1 Tax=Desulfuromonas sp. TaxID=892 RepID=UPI000CB94C9D|nr:thermonuclease family protein [Desulfuromonas sp.]PLX83677.1 MAG: hypothetical protein C0617_11120 [Desulfuromonas sp.]
MITHRILLALMFVAYFSVPSFAELFTGKVVRVLDGDTVDVLHDGKPERVRLAEIDCPETDQAFGKAAKRYVLDLVAQKVVSVDVTEVGKYGRSIGVVTLQGDRNLNRELVRAGYAWWYRKYSDDASIGTLETEARIARRGLWQDKTPVPPWEWRKAKRLEASNGK